MDKNVIQKKLLLLNSRSTYGIGGNKMDENIKLKKVQVLILRGTLDETVLMECDIENVFSGFHLSVFTELERGYVKAFISVHDSKDRMVCGHTFDLKEISDLKFRLQALTNNINDVILEAKKIIKE